EPFKKLDVRWSGIRAGGLSQFHSRLLDRWAANAGRLPKVLDTRKGYAVETMIIWGCRHELYGDQVLDRGLWPHNERRRRGCILERVEGDRTRAAHDVVGVGRRN